MLKTKKLRTAVEHTRQTKLLLLLLCGNNHYVTAKSIQGMLYPTALMKTSFYCIMLLGSDGAGDGVHKPGIYGSGRVWANAWDVFTRMPSRVGRGRWADVGFVVCFPWGGIFILVFFLLFSFSSNVQRTRPAASMGHLASFTSLVVMGV